MENILSSDVTMVLAIDEHFVSTWRTINTEEHYKHDND